MISRGQALFLIVLGVLNGGVRAEIAAKNAAALTQKLLHLEFPLSAAGSECIEELIRQPTALSRFPNRSAKFIYENLRKIQVEYLGDPRRAFYSQEDALRPKDEIEGALKAFAGIGPHKAKVLTALIYALKGDCLQVDHDFISSGCPALIGTMDVINELFGEFDDQESVF